MKHRSIALIVVVAALALLRPAATAAGDHLSPSDTVRRFYGLLQDGRYVEGFAYSVFREAIEGLSPAELGELKPDFEQTFDAIPSLEVSGEQISGETATVFVHFGGSEAATQVTLVKDGGQWVVGDRETLEVVRRQKTAFFFNARINVNQNEVLKILKTVSDSEYFYFTQKKQYATLDELVDAQALPEDIRGGPINGYDVVVTVAPDRTAYSAVATPQLFGRTGLLSFYVDKNGVRAAEKGGRPIGTEAPLVTGPAFDQ